MRITAERLLAMGAQSDCSQLKRFREVFPRGVAITKANIERALAARLEVGWLAASGGLTRKLTLWLLPTLSDYWRGEVVRYCERLTREDILAALPTLSADRRGRVVCYCDRLTREDVLVALPTLSADWRGRVMSDCERLTPEDRERLMKGEEAKP